MKTTTVIYHAGCPDGVCAAWAAWKKLGDAADYIPARYEGEVPEDRWFEGRDVYLVDFSYPLATLERISKVAKSVTVLDHHKSAEEALRGTVYASRIRQDWSGAHIAWDFFHPNSTTSTIVRYVEDHDLWLHKLPHREAIKVVSEMVDLKAEDVIQQWDKLADRMETNLAEVQEQGSAIVEYRNSMIRRASHSPPFTVLDGYVVPCVNTNFWPSEIGDVLNKGYLFSVTWRATKEGFFAYSLRSDKETGIDVSAVAAKFGGGGHRHAAGFVSSAPPMIVGLKVG